MRIEQDVNLYATRLSDGEAVEHEMPAGRHGWVQVARGSVFLNGELLEEGDGAALSEVQRIELRGKSGAEVLVFDLG